MSTETGSRVKLISERESRPPDPQEAARAWPDVTAPNTPRATAAARSTPSSPAFLQQMMAVLSAMAAMLAARFLLLLAAVGAFLLAYQSLQTPTTMTLAITIAYDLLVVVPLVYLYLNRG